MHAARRRAKLESRLPGPSHLDSFLAAHRDLDRLLDELLTALDDPGLLWREHFLRAYRAAGEHYRHEDAGLFRAVSDWSAAAKMMDQHLEVLEIGRALEQAVTEEEGRYIARRFRALAQHNIIEEERDVFPLLDRQA